ncbi:MAG TPA: exodeoxyribonuclease VII small subunit [Gammaproteobacteria bacterium]|jgi:exodeoxyribonuclease VII small subunit|nr:exodeoxyribonuclease VII small subunit [Gammaproteobacteria bacterium]
MTKKLKHPDLETSLAEINSLVEQMERGELTLEQSLSHFERGITLIKHAQKILQTSEQKVQKLMKSQGEETLIDFENGEE